MKPLGWIGSSLEDLRGLPAPVRQVFGYAFHLAQTGGKARSAKPLRGFGGAGVLEVVEYHDGDSYRAVYTVKFEQAVYVLHIFQKKSTSGIATRKADIDKIVQRLRQAEQEYAAWTRTGRSP